MNSKEITAGSSKHVYSSALKTTGTAIDHWRLCPGSFGCCMQMTKQINSNKCRGDWANEVYSRVAYHRRLRGARSLRLSAQKKLRIASG